MNLGICLSNILALSVSDEKHVLRAKFDICFFITITGSIAGGLLVYDLVILVFTL